MDPTTIEAEKDTHDVEERESATKVHNEPSAPEWTPLDKKIVLKLDCLVIPMVTMVYLLAFLDRANIGNARVVSTFTHPVRVYMTDIQR
jgi:hypothetical protein